MLIFVSACNFLAAVGILAVWLRESRHQPNRAFVRLMHLRYARFFIVYALMMNRFIRYKLWAAGVPGTTAVPYWPLTGAELGMLTCYLILGVATLVTWRWYEVWKKGEPLDTGYCPFHPVVFFYPVMLPGLKITKGEKGATIFLSCLSTMIWVLGFISVLATTLFSAKNVR